MTQLKDMRESFFYFSEKSLNLDLFRASMETSF